MADIGNVTGRLTLDPSGFTQGINKAITELTRFVQQAGTASKKAGSVFGNDLQKAITQGFVTGKNPFKDITSLMEKEVLRLTDKVSSLGKNQGVTELTNKFKALELQIDKVNKIAASSKMSEKFKAGAYRAMGFSDEDIKKITTGDPYAGVLSKLQSTQVDIKKAGYEELNRQTQALVASNGTLGKSTLDLQQKKENLTRAMANEKTMYQSITGTTAADATARQRHSDAYVANKKALESVNKEMGVFTTGSRRAGMSIQSLIKWQTEWYLSQGMIFGFVNAIKASIGNLVSFEQRLANLKAITGATTAETAMLGRTARDLGISSRLSAIEIADGMTILGQAGFSAKETMEAMRAVVALSVSTLETMAVSVDLVTTSLRAFELDATKASDVANTLAAGANYSKLTMGDLKTAFNYVASTGHQAGMSLEEVVAALGTMRDRGIQASTMATGLRGILGVLIAPTDRFRREIEKVGLKMNEINPLYNNFGDILLKLRDHGFSVANAFAGVDKRQAGAIVTVIQGADAYARMLSKISDTNAAFEMQEIQLKTVQSAWLMLKNNVTEFGLKIGDSLLPALNAILTPLQLLTKGMNELGSSISSQTERNVRWAGSVVAIAGLAALAVNGLWPFIKAMFNLEKGIIAVKLAMASTNVLAWLGGWGGAVTLIAMIVTGFGMWVQEASKLKQELVDLNKTSETNLLTLKDFQKELSKVGTSNEKLKGIVERLVTLYPQLKTRMDDFGGSVKGVTEEIRKLNEEQAKNYLMSVQGRLQSSREKVGGALYPSVTFLGKKLGIDTTQSTTDWARRDIGTYEKIKREKERQEEIQKTDLNYETSKKRKEYIDKLETVMAAQKEQAQMLKDMEYFQGAVTTPTTVRGFGVQRQALSTFLSEKYGITDVESILGKGKVAEKKEARGGLSDKEQAEANAKVRAYEGVAKTLRDFEYRSGQERIRAEIAAAKEAGRSVEEEEKIHVLNIQDIKEDALKKSSDLDTQEQILETERTKYNNADYLKLLQQLEDNRFILAVDTNKKLESEETRYQNRLKEVLKKEQTTREEFNSALLDHQRGAEKRLEKEQRTALQAQGKIRRVWNADVEKIEEEHALQLETIQKDLNEDLRYLAEDFRKMGVTDYENNSVFKAQKDFYEAIARSRITAAGKKKEADVKNAIFGKTPLEGFTAGIESANKSIGTLGDNIEKLTTGTIKNFTDGITDAFVAWTDGSKSAGDAFRDFTEIFLREVHKQITAMAVAYMMQQLLGWATKALTYSSTGSYTLGGEGLSSGVSSSGSGFVAAVNLPTGKATGGILPNIKSFRKFSSGGTTSSPALALLGDNASKKELVIPSENISDNKVSGYTRNKGEESRDNVIINLFDKNLVPALIAEYPGATLNVISADIVKRGITFQAIRSVR